MLIDSHAHIQGKEYAGEAADVIARARAAGVEKIIAVGGAGDMSSNTEAVALADSFPNIYATVGMHPHDGVSPLAPSELHCRLVMDLINRPQRTQLLKIAARKGITTVPGVEMLIAQGIAQWEIWMEKRAPEASMRRAVLAALRAEENSRDR